MSQAKVNGVVEMNYAYNAFGQQVAKYIAGQTTVSLHDETGHWLGDCDGAGQPIRQMVWLDDLPVAALDGDAIRDIQPDHLGTPRVVIDRATDTTIWRWRLGGEAFGASPPNEDPDGDGTRYVVVGNPKGMASGKNWGFSIATGHLNNTCASGKEVDRFIDGSAKSMSLYRGIGGGVTTNTSGTAFEVGFGFGGGSFDYTHSSRIQSLGSGW